MLVCEWRCLSTFYALALNSHGNPMEVLFLVFILHIRNRSMEKVKLLIQDHVTHAWQSRDFSWESLLQIPGSYEVTLSSYHLKRFCFPVPSVVRYLFLVNGFILLPLEGHILLVLPDRVLLYHRWTCLVVGISFCSLAAGLLCLGILAHILPPIACSLPPLPSSLPCV